MPDMADQLTQHTLASPHKKRLILILGGARSGKSSYAEMLATRMARGASVVYVATATPGDDEMRERIVRHQASRPAEWRTIEEPTDPATALAGITPLAAGTVVLLDCLTLLVANVLLTEPSPIFDEDHVETQSLAAAEARVSTAIERLLTFYHEGERSLILVSNEVGMGVVPPYSLGRVYRDILGRVNSRVAAVADAAILIVAGLPIELKSLSDAWDASLARLLDEPQRAP